MRTLRKRRPFTGYNINESSKGRYVVQKHIVNQNVTPPPAIRHEADIPEQAEIRLVLNASCKRQPDPRWRIGTSPLPRNTIAIQFGSHGWTLRPPTAIPYLEPFNFSPSQILHTKE